jgi:hypothetical protein
LHAADAAFTTRGEDAFIQPKELLMGKSIAIIGGAAALAAGSLLALPAQASSASLYVQVAPPAVRYEAAPGYRHGHEWVAGHWQWQGHRHVWVPGYWVASRPGYSYRQPRWVGYDNRWGYQPGGWIQIGIGSNHGYAGGYYDNRHGYRYSRPGGHDFDRDGIPNRWDRDRDGDGVPNYRDRRPNRPYRY